MTTTRSYADLPQPATEALPSRFDAPQGGRWAWRLRVGLLVVIAGVALFIWLGRTRHTATPAPVPAASPATQPAAPDNGKADEDEVRVRISPPPAG